MRLVTSLATMVVMATVVAAFAGDRALGSPSNSRPARSETVIRPPALIPSSRTNAAAAPKTSSADTRRRILALEGSARGTGSTITAGVLKAP
jgi:hypothetical protein